MTNHYRDTVDFFDTAAVTRRGYYDAGVARTRTHLPQLRMVWWIALRMLGQPRSVLDIGCGRGDFTARMSDATGCDVSVEAVTLARQINPGQQFVAAELRDLPFGAGEFDASICVNVIHHVLPKDRPAAIGEMARVSRKTVVVEFKNARSLYFHGKRTQTFAGITVYRTDVQEIAAEMAKHGFTLTKVRGIFGPLWLSPWAVARFDHS